MEIILDSPISYITRSISAGNHLSESFIFIISKLYCYAELKEVMDLVATLCCQKRLMFKLENKDVFDLDNGNCKFLHDEAYEIKYVISIKKLSIDIILHEIAHMVESEAAGSLNFTEFMQRIGRDIHSLEKTDVMHHIIEQVMMKEVARYPSSQHISELFARYYQLFAHTKEVGGKNNGGYSIEHLKKATVMATEWIDKQLTPLLRKKADKAIMDASKSYIGEKIKHSWQHEKVKPKANKWSDRSPSIMD